MFTVRFDVCFLLFVGDYEMIRVCVAVCAKKMLTLAKSVTFLTYCDGFAWDPTKVGSKVIQESLEVNDFRRSKCFAFFFPK